MQALDGAEIVAGGGERLPTRLSTTALPPEKIGGKSFQARFAIVESRHVTYQQKTHVFGYVAPTRGGTYNGYGAVYGGGGSINSKSESVVQVVYCDFDGCENTAELPASVSAREGSVMRLDFLNGVLFAAQNISGRQETRGLLGPESFISMPQWSGVLTLLTVVSLFCLSGSFWKVGLIAGLAPAFVLYRRYEAKRQRAALGGYMGRALTSSPA